MEGEMRFKERLDNFLELQNKGISFDIIAKELGISTSTLRSFLNKRGYKSDGGKYILKEDRSEKTVNREFKQIVFDEANEKQGKLKRQPELKEEKSIAKNTKKAKKDRKINITQDDLDKLCEVYDWYLEVKDYKCMKPKKTSNKKDVNLDEKVIHEIKSTNIKVDKKVWEDFERLCSNSKFSKQEVITQALKDFMKEYRDLI